MSFPVPLQLLATATRPVHTAPVLKMTPVGVETLASFTAYFTYYLFVLHIFFGVIKNLDFKWILLAWILENFYLPLIVIHFKMK